MKVLLLENHELPLVSGAALIRTGNLFDPPTKRGLAGLTGEVLRSGGTPARTGDQLDQDLENVAASIESQIGESNGTLSFSCLKENTDQVLALFRDLLTSPQFRQDKVDLAKTQSRSEISRRNDDADGIAEREFSDIVYGRNTPYGWSIEYADIDNIQRQDLIDFYHRYYFPANITMEVIGDFSTAEMKAKLEQILGSWKYTQPAVPAFPKVEDKAAPGVFLASKDDTTQTFFHVGELGGELRDKDYPALEVAADILGGGFHSRLFQSVRTKHGWAYNISASWAANYDHPGTFVISGSTQSAHTVDTLKAIGEELEKIRTTEVTDDELQTAKDTVLNGFVFNFDRPSKTLNRLLTYEYYGYPKDFIFQYQKAIAAVTKADVLRVAQQYFQPKNLSYVAVGNPKDFGTPLASLGLKVEPIDLTIPEPKQEAAQADPASHSDQPRGQRQSALSASAASFGRRGQAGGCQRSAISRRRRGVHARSIHEGEANQLVHRALHGPAGQRASFYEAVRLFGRDIGLALGDARRAKPDAAGAKTNPWGGVPADREPGAERPRCGSHGEPGCRWGARNLIQGRRKRPDYRG